jgi:hypothetical protein
VAPCSPTTMSGQMNSPKNRDAVHAPVPRPRCSYVSRDIAQVTRVGRSTPFTNPAMIAPRITSGTTGAIDTMRMPIPAALNEPPSSTRVPRCTNQRKRKAPIAVANDATAVEAEDPRPLRHEGLGDAAPDPARRARHRCDPPAEAHPTPLADHPAAPSDRSRGSLSHPAPGPTSGVVRRRPAVVSCSRAEPSRAEPSRAPPREDPCENPQVRVGAAVVLEHSGGLGVRRAGW